MQTIKIRKVIDAQHYTAAFYVNEHEIASIKQNACLPPGYYRGKVRGFDELFAYSDNFHEAVENVADFIQRTFAHEFGIEVQFT